MKLLFEEQHNKALNRSNRCASQLDGLPYFTQRLVVIHSTACLHSKRRLLVNKTTARLHSKRRLLVNNATARVSDTNRLPHIQNIIPYYKQTKLNAYVNII
jgi:hypothetical protein